VRLLQVAENIFGKESLKYKKSLRVLKTQSKTIKRTVAIECYTNHVGKRTLSEIESAYRKMLTEMIGFALKNDTTQKILHRTFYKQYRKGFPWLATRLIKGSYRDVLKRIKSFKELKMKGIAKTDKPTVRRVTITFSDSQDWKLENGAIWIRSNVIKDEWLELKYRDTKLLHRYLYHGWALTEELKIKLVDGKIFCYLTFKKEVEVKESKNVLAVDVNENNVTAVLFKDGKIAEAYRIETGLGNLVISYSERRRRITQGKSTKDREVKKSLKKLREKERKEDTIYQTSSILEKIATKSDATIVVGEVFKGKKKIEEKTYSDRLRHRMHQWSVVKLVDVLENKLLYVDTINEAYTSTTDPFTRKRLTNFTPLMMRYAWRGRKRAKVVKFRLRMAENGLDRDVIGAINIGLRYLSSNGSPMALGSTEPHAVWLKLMIPHLGLTQTMQLKVLRNN